MTFAVKKQRKPNLIQSEEKNNIKDKFLDSGTDQMKANDNRRMRTSTERERERPNLKPHTTLADFPLLRFEGRN